MCRVIEEMLKDTEFRTHVENLKALTKNLGCTVQEALKVLQIPESEHERYIAAIES